GLVAVVARMMAKNPEDRYQPPADVAAALEPFARGTTAAAVAVAVPVTPPAADPAESVWQTLAGDEDPGKVKPRLVARGRERAEETEADVPAGRPARRKKREEQAEGDSKRWLLIGGGVGAG